MRCLTDLARLRFAMFDFRDAKRAAGIGPVAFQTTYGADRFQRECDYELCEWLDKCELWNIFFVVSCLVGRGMTHSGILFLCCGCISEQLMKQRRKAQPQNETPEVKRFRGKKFRIASQSVGSSVPQVRPTMIDKECLEIEREAGSKYLIEFRKIQEFLEMHFLLNPVLIEL